MNKQRSPLYFVRPFHRSFLFKVLAIVSLLSFPTTWGPWSVLTAQEVDPFEDFQLILQDLGEWASHSIDSTELQHFVPDVLAKTLKDGDEVIRWVNDHIHWVPYHGVLKGADGTLLAKQGNNWDRSLLLASLLKLKGYEVRLVKSDLNGDLQKHYLELLLEELAILHQSDGSRFRWNAPSYLVGDTPQIVEKYEGSKKDVILNQIVSQRSEFVKLLDQVDVETEREVKLFEPLLLDVLKSDVGSDIVASQTSSHIWVQYSKDGGDWESVSLVFSDSDLAALEASKVAVYDNSESIPSEAKHHVVFRVVVEKTENGETTKATALETGFDSFQMGNTQIKLSFAPSHGLGIEEATEMGVNDPEGYLVGLQESILNETKWTPILRIEGTGSDISDQTIHLTGDLSSVGSDPLGTTEALGNAMGLLSQLGTGSSSSSKSVLSGVYLEIETKSPHSESIIDRREIFQMEREDWNDSGSSVTEEFANQRALAMTQSRVFQTLVGQVSREWMEWKTNVALRDANLAFSYVIKSIERNNYEIDTRAIAKVLEKIDQYESLLGILSMFRTVEGGVFLHSPNLVSFVTQKKISDDESWSTLFGIDWINNGVLAVDTFGKVDKSKVFRSGVRDTVIETELLRHSSAGVAEENASSILIGLERLEGWKIDEEFSESKNPEVDRAKKLDLANGYLILGENVADATQWWRVDPLTGETLGMGKSSFGIGGQETVEYANLVTMVATKAAAIVGFVKCVDSAKKAGTSGLGCTVCLMIGMAAGSIAVMGLAAGSAATVGAVGSIGGLGCAIL